MRYWEKLKSYFLDGYDVFTAEIQLKIKYLFFFNAFAVGGLIIYLFTRIFNPEGYIILAGDFCLVLFITISLIAIRLKKIYAVTFSVIFIPIAMLFYNVLSFYAADQEIDQANIFSTLSFLMFGLLYLSLFSVKVNQLIFFTLISAATLIINCFFIINGPFGFRESSSVMYNLVGALIELGGGFLIALLILKFNASLFKNNEKGIVLLREQNSALFTNISDAFGLIKILTDDLGRTKDFMILEVNKAGEKYLGKSRDEIVFKKYSELIKPDPADFKKWLKEITLVATTGKESHQTIYSKHFKKWLYVQVFSPERNYCAILLRDITASIEADFELKRIQEHNTALLEAIPDTIIVCDKAGFIKTYKKAQIKLIENEHLFQVGSYISKAPLPKELIKLIMESIGEVLDSNKTKTKVLEIPMESRIIYTEARIVPMAENEVLILFRDLTRRILSEKALLVEKEKAEESDRLKMAFLSNMSHEIRTPMNAIIGFSEMLGMEDVDAKERGDFIYQIQSNGALLLNLINDILDLSKIEAGELEMHYSKFNVNKILKDIYLNFENEKNVRNKSQITILLEEPPNIKSVSVSADEYRFKQILFNLMGNALKFTNSGTITIGYIVKETELLFYVKDTGIGIPIDKQEIIFHRFRQVEDSNTRTFGGAGLGLTISSNLVEAMGGRIWVELNEPQGSAFYFTLPLNDASIIFTDNSTSSLSRNPYQWKGKSILIIDSETSNYVVIEHLLSKTGVSMEWASNNQIVLTMCQIRKPDLVIIDTDVSSIKDEEIEKTLKIRYPLLPIIALKSEQAIQHDLPIKGSIDAVVQKPLKTRNFLETINQFLGEINGISPH